MEHKFTGGDPQVYVLKQKTATKYRVDVWNPVSGSYDIFLSEATITDTSGEISIGVIKDYALVVAYAGEATLNEFYSMADGSLIKTENVAHRLLQAK